MTGTVKVFNKNRKHTYLQQTKTVQQNVNTKRNTYRQQSCIAI